MTLVSCTQCGSRVAPERTVFSDGDRLCPECFEALKGARREALLAQTGKPHYATAAGLGFLLGLLGVVGAILLANWSDAVSGLAVVLPSAGVAYGVFVGSGLKRGPRIQALAVAMAAAFYLLNQYALFTLAASRRLDPPRLFLLSPGDFVKAYADNFVPLDPVFFGVGLFIAAWVPRAREY